MHKESDFKVRTSVAESAALLPLGKTFTFEDEAEPLYNILIELMSNTHHHAGKVFGQTKWWLHVRVDSISNITYVSFIDLGVGVFESMVVKDYFKSIIKGTFLLPYINYADDLLEGKIQSRIEKDNRLRGKGLPQIVSYSKLDNFKIFYLITNDVKINLKTGGKTQLKNNFKGTLYYFEIHPNVYGN